MNIANPPSPLPGADDGPVAGSPLLLRAAEQAAGRQQWPAGALYVVATPIGNLADITLRALHALARADAIAAEDTRVAARLADHLGLPRRPLVPLHAHNEAGAADVVLQHLTRGERVVLVSDAGTPAVSDPGARLVARVREAGHRIVPIPGPSSATAALSVAGDVAGADHAGGFRFAGFLPAKGAERRGALDALLADPHTVVLFEAPHRIEALARELGERAAERTVTVARELTKQFEQIESMPGAALAGWLAADAQRLRGEFVLVLHALPRPTAAAPPGGGGGERLEPAVERTLGLLLAAVPLKQAVALAAEIHGAPRKALYARALALRAAAPD